MGRVSPVSQSTMRLPADLSSRAWPLLPVAFVASLLLGYGVIGLVLWGCESCVSYFIFQPDRTLYAKPSDYSFNVRDVGLRIKGPVRDRKSTRLNSSHVEISYAVFCL